MTHIGLQCVSNAADCHIRLRRLQLRVLPEFSSVAELKASGKYQFNHAVAAQLGYTAIYFSRLRHADESIRWSLPNFGILDSATEHSWMDGLHASVEYRR